MVRVGNLLNTLRGKRNRADYDLARTCDQLFAASQLGIARDIIRVIDNLVKTPTVLAGVITAIRAYERDVLCDVTYRGP